ncbi:MAG: carbon starvation protein A [Eubacterium sp.]|nr:carbon starvation protein A [Eubacterium sp.]
MITFFIGLAILIIGGALYGRFVERVMKPTDVQTPATRMRDGVDFVPMKKWRNSLIELLNIAGTGPILGPIQGALFGPIAFLTIPIGCVIGGAVHDYMVGMISMRCDGEQTPAMVRRFLGKHIYHIYQVFVCLLLLLLGVVFIYTPGDLFVTQIMNQDASLGNPVIIIVYAVIFLYYIIATLFPIDKIIGKVYPIFGAILLLSAVGVFFGMFIKGYPMKEIWDTGIAGIHPFGEHFIPIFFVTVACGIVSGFHSTQATLVSRSVMDEREGRTVFYDMMIAEGFIAMIWAAAAMGAMYIGITDADTLHGAPTSVVGIVAKDMLGSIGGIIAIVGVIVLPITSGDTALRSLRLIIGDALHIDQTKKKNCLPMALVIFGVVAAVLIYSKMDANGFNILWRYFSWANEVTAVFAFTFITAYMIRKKMPFLIALLPGCFYCYVCISYILNARIGFGLPWTAAYIISGVLTALYAVLIIWYGRKRAVDPLTSSMP